MEPTIPHHINLVYALADNAATLTAASAGDAARLKEASGQICSA
jgi:hypothetical protein